MKYNIFKQFAEVQFEVPARQLSTYKGGGNAKAVCYPTTVEELLSVLSLAKQEGIAYSVLGNGSNTLISDNGFSGLVLCTRRIKGVTTSKNRLTALCGDTLPSLYRLTAPLGLSGFERLAGIPSTVGGAVVMNAGAYGADISNGLTSVVVIDTNSVATATKSASELGLSYRRSDLKSHEIVASATFSLDFAEPATVTATYAQCAEKRRTSQPQAPSLGCVFKATSDGTPAGLLIDRCGLKGSTHGGAQVSERHANFIINRGKGTASDFLHLRDLCRDRVYKEFGTTLCDEIKYLGDI